MTPEQERAAPYGYCPICGSKGVARERRPNGNDRCEAGHVYPATEARAARTAEPAPDFSDPTRRAFAEHIVSLACAWPDAVDRGEALDAAAESALWKAAYFGALAATITPAPPVMPTQTVWQVMQEIDQSILRSAAQDVVDRWDTPLWKEAVHTGDYIEALRMALALNPVVPASATYSELRQLLYSVQEVLARSQRQADHSRRVRFDDWVMLEDELSRVLAAASVVPSVQAGANVLERIDIKVQAGLGCMTFGGTRAFLEDIREIVKSAAAPEGQS